MVPALGAAGASSWEQMAQVIAMNETAQRTAACPLCRTWYRAGQLLPWLRAVVALIVLAALALLILAGSADACGPVGHAGAGCQYSLAIAEPQTADHATAASALQTASAEDRHRSACQ